MEHLEPGQDFVLTIVKMLVDYPEAVNVQTEIDKMGVLIYLKVDDRDLGKVIGKHGVTINAIRSLLRVLGAKQGARYSLKVEDGKEHSADNNYDSRNREDNPQPTRGNYTGEEVSSATMEAESSPSTPAIPETPANNSSIADAMREDIQDLDDLDL